MPVRFYLSLLLLAVLLPGPVPSLARELTTVPKILTLSSAPAGVVFEIVSARRDGLQQVLPGIKTDIDKLHAKFPSMPIAIVTHGNEMFALQTSQHNKHEEVVSLTKSLAESGVHVHVCGTYAGMKGVSEEDFPSFVNVAAAGPTQIEDYVAVGYLHVKVHVPRK